MTAPPIGPAVIGVDPSIERTGIAIIGRAPNNAAQLRLITDVGYGDEDGKSYDDRLNKEEAILHAIHTKITRAIEERGAQIQLIVIEGPIYGLTKYSRETGKQLPSQFDRAGLWTSLTRYLRRINGRTPWAVVTPSTREMFITGVGSKGDKPRVLEEMRNAWAPNNRKLIQNHDQADALGLATAGAIHLGWQMPFRLRRCHVEGVHNINWPAAAKAAQ